MNSQEADKILAKRPILARGAIIREAGEDGEPKMRCSVSSETACRNIIRTKRGWEIGEVVLSHSEGAIEGAWIADGIALRDDHGGEIVARGMDCRIEEGKLVAASIVWGASDRAKTIRADAESGVIRSLSIEADYEPEDVEEREDGTFFVRRWTPLAAAFVPVPADPTVGIDREFLAAALARSESPAADPQTISAEADPAGAGEAEATTTKTKRANMSKTTEEGKEALVNPAPVVEVADETEVTREELRDYNLLRAIRAMVEHRPDIAKSEMAVSRKLARKFGKEPQGFFVPQGLFTRDFSTGAGSGAGLVPTEHMASEFIDILRAKMILDRVGVRYLNGLTGNVAIPKQTASTTAYWVAEGASPTESQPVVGQITMTPHTVGAYTDITRLLLLQGSPDAAALVQNDLLMVLGRAIQDAVLNGTGTSGQPTGILNTEGVTTGTVTVSGSPTWAEIVQFAASIDRYWADGGNWVLAPASFAALRATKRDNYVSRFVADIENGQKFVADEPAYTTTQLSAGKAIYGKFENVVVGLWGALDVMVDPYSLSTSGGIRIVALQDCDVAVRHPEAFVITDKFPQA